MGEVLYLLRHCQATGQHPDAPLTDAGRRQSEALADRFSSASVERIVSSPYTRAVQSVVPLAERHGLQIETDDRLIERVLGETSSSDWREALRRSFEDMDLRWPGGETSREAMARGAVVLEELRHHAAPVTVVVTHGNLLTLMLRHFDGQSGYEAWIRLTNPDAYRLEWSDGEGVIKRLNTEAGGDFG